MKDMRCHCMFCHCCLLKDTCCQWCDERHVQFSSTQNGFYVLGKARIRSTQSLRRFPDVGFETVPSDWRWPSLVLSSKIVECSSFHASLLQATDGVMSLALCSLVVSQAPQHFRSPETHGSVTDVTYVSHFFTPRQSGTDVTKDMCCHWKTCCSCCLTKDLFCHCCDGGNVAGVTKDMLSQMLWRTGVVTV